MSEHKKNTVTELQTTVAHRIAAEQNCNQEHTVQTLIHHFEHS